MREDTIYSSVFRLLVAIALVSLSFFFLTADMRSILVVIPDDAAYYFKIAANAAASEGFTFDGINRTNGFQPLWLYLLVPVCSIYRGTPEALCRTFLVLQLIFLTGAALVLHSIQSRFFSSKAVFMSGLLFLFFVFVSAANGMESAVLVFFLVLLFFFGWKTEIFSRHDAGRQFVFGALLGLVVLSRLDMIFLAGIVLAFSLGRVLKEREPRAVIALGAVLAGLVVVVSPYLLYNRLAFGSIVPINAALKSSFPRITSAGYALSKLGRRDWIGVIVALGYLAWFVIRLRELKKNPLRRMFFQAGMAIMGCTVLMHFLHTLFFMKWAVFRWHFIPYALFWTAAVCEPVDRLVPAGAGATRRFVYWAAVAALIVCGAFAVVRNFRQPFDRSWPPVAYEAALWARQNTDGNAVFAMKDAGNFGYFSERRVVNLDGVVNNLDYQKTLRDKNLANYLRGEGVQFIVQHAFWDRPDVLSGEYRSYSMSYMSHKYESSSDTIELSRADEVFRSRPYFDGPYRTVFIIWRLRNE